MLKKKTVRNDYKYQAKFLTGVCIGLIIAIIFIILSTTLRVYIRTHKDIVTVREHDTVIYRTITDTLKADTVKIVKVRTVKETVKVPWAIQKNMSNDLNYTRQLLGLPTRFDPVSSDIDKNLPVFRSDLKDIIFELRKRYKKWPTY